MPTQTFADCYSERAEEYSRYRPRYPDLLFDRLADLVPDASVCWDCATGNGQAAVGLARRFARVVATDASAEQIARAFPHPRVEYRCEQAEATSLPSASVDLVSVASALHWLDRPAFYAEVRRVLRPGGVLATWTYQTRVLGSAPVQAVVFDFGGRVLRPHTRPELEHVHSAYRELEFPFSELVLPDLTIRVEWTLCDLVGWMDTWSAAVQFRKDAGHPATDLLRGELEAAWVLDGPPAERRTLELPLCFRVGRL